MGCISSATEANRLRNEVIELKRKLATKERCLSLTEATWKPLCYISEKFSEFDTDKSGYINRTEFHKLCENIESNLIISRLYSIQEQHSCSSVYNEDAPGFGHNSGTLDSNQAWSAKENNHQQWYQIDAIIPIFVKGCIVQGRKNCDQWIKTFKIEYSEENGQEWKQLENSKIFNVNNDRNTKK
eukprot:231870_1